MISNTSVNRQAVKLMHCGVKSLPGVLLGNIFLNMESLRFFHSKSAGVLTFKSRFVQSETVCLCSHHMFEYSVSGIFSFWKLRRDARIFRLAAYQRSA